MKGGFVTRNCPDCNSPSTLPNHVFEELDLYIACPECRIKMESKILDDKNYGYVCEDCKISIALYDILPRYEDL